MNYLQRGINRCVEPCGGGGGISAGANVGAGTGQVFRDITGGTTFNLRTLLSPTGTVSIVTNGDVVELEAVASNVGGGEGIFATDLDFKSLTSTGNTVTITSTATTVNLEVAGLARGSQDFSDAAGGSPFSLALTTLSGALTSPAMVLVNGSLSITPAGSGLLETASFQIIATTDGTAGGLGIASDVVQVDGPNALTTISLSTVTQTGNDFELVFAVTGAGQTATFNYTTELI